jgi:serine/threonine-protein kinase
VLIGDAGGREWAYLTDFGLTKQVAAATELTESGKWMGTADYASPEQIQGKELDARSDVYSLGCVFYEALTGRIPFERDEPVAKLYAHVNDPPPKVSDHLTEPAPSLDAVVERALAKKPSDRYPSAGDLGRAALAASRGDQETRPERSVARGEAAPESQMGPATKLTRRLAGLTGGTDRLHGRRPGWLVPLVALLALAIVGFGAVSLLGGGDDEGGDGNGDDRPIPAGIEVLDPITVGKSPLSVTVGEGFAWVTNEEDGTVSHINEATGEVSAEAIEVGKEPANIRYGGGSVWVSNAGSDTVSRIDPKSARVEQTIKVGKRPTGVRVAGNDVWVANADDGTVSRIDARNGKVTDTIQVGNDPAGIAIERGLVWVVNSGDGTVSRLNARNGSSAGAPARVGGRPRGIVADFGSIWVTNSTDDYVSRVSQTTAQETDTIGVGDMPAQVMHGDGFIWVANQGSDDVSRIDHNNNRVTAVIPVGAEPRGIAAGDELIWVVNSGANTVSRIVP